MASYATRHLWAAARSLAGFDGSNRNFLTANGTGCSNNPAIDLGQWVCRGLAIVNRSRLHHLAWPECVSPVSVTPALPHRLGIAAKCENVNVTSHRAYCDRHMKPPLAVVFLAFLHTAQSPAPENFLTDVRLMAAAETNEDRFNALTAMLRARNLTYSVQRFTLDKPIRREPRTEGRNVIVTIGTGAESIVVGAHYDAVRLSDGTLSHGAVDNAASSVILVRLAEALRADDLPRQVKMIWFDMEELGLIGSRRYIQAYRTDQLIAMLNFDVNGYGGTVLYGPSEHGENRRLRRSLMSVCAAEDRSCVAMPQMPPGDDRSFVSARIPTLSIATLPAIEAHQLWLMMNAQQDSGLAQGHTPAILRTIHTHEDTPAHVDGDTMGRMLRFAHTLVREVARSPAKPGN